jgi:hypothetical protein
MLSWIREKFGTVLVYGIIILLALVFVFFGVFNPKSTRGLHEGAVAGTVNGDSVSISEFNRELNRRMEFFKNMGGGKFTDEQLKQFRVREGVFQELANRKLMIQEAHRQGLIAADEEVKEKIREIPAFQKDGKFDVVTYKQVLESNNHTPASFERLVREDVSLQQWEGYFQSRVHVSDAELRKEFAVSQDKRNIKYVLLTADSAKKAVKVDEADVQKFLKDPAKLNLAKIQFEEAKNGPYKGMKFEAAQETIARGILAADKNDEIQKINLKLADQIVSLMTADKSSDAKVNALLKPYGVDIKTSGLITRKSGILPNVGEAKDLMADAFADKSPVDPKQGGQAKKYPLAGRVLVAVVTETQRADPAQFSKDQDTLKQQITSRKSRELFQDWMGQLTKKAKIEMNPSVVSSASGE